MCATILNWIKCVILGRAHALKQKNGSLFIHSNSYNFAKMLGEDRCKCL